MKRRLLLSRVIKLLVIIGFVFLLTPFLLSLSPDSNDNKQNKSVHWVVNLPVADLDVGKIKKVSWSGGVVWVYARSTADLESLKDRDELLKDSLSEESDQPDKMKTQYRSADKSYFVFIPLENIRSCQVRLITDAISPRFTEPCYGSTYDAAGRIFSKRSHSKQLNLAVPNHIIEEGVLKIGNWTRQ